MVRAPVETEHVNQFAPETEQEVAPPPPVDGGKTDVWADAAAAKQQASKRMYA
jgi:hypothetical protein